MFLQLVICAVFGVYGVKGQLTFGCSKEILTEIETCFNSSPNFNSKESTSVLRYFATPNDAVCGKTTELLALAKCVHDANLQCFDDSFKTTFPTDEMKAKTLNYICSRINSFNATCEKKSLENRVSCSVKGIDLFPSTYSPTYEEMKAYICGVQKNSKKCIQDSIELDTCPETKKTMLERVKLSNPEACGGEVGFESGVFDERKNSAPHLYQSVVLLTTITLMKFIF